MKKSPASLRRFPHHPSLRRPIGARSASLSARSSRSSGFTLIEVLVALVVLVLGVLGAAAMTLNSLKDTKQSGLQTQATQLAYELGDLMRANPGQEATFTGGTRGSVASCWTSGCVPSDMAKNDFYEWYTKLQSTSGLPNGSAVVCHDATKLADPTLACDNAATAPLVVKLKWDEKNNNARGQAATGAVTTRILAVTVRPCVAILAASC